ncbi:hypothetical protein [Paenibacillus periandrae]|uniref:hypothetical protein n=1 Tax=Paenibacillus periandrae TaxID=1761741 RepID=UPI001F08F6FD|nr:hypothetical protein [Paenibacillus periandrae]
MKKVTMNVKEKLTYTREIEVQIPDEMTEEQFEALCIKMERSEDLDSALHVLEKIGIIIGPYDKDMNSPDDGEVEVFEFHIEGT